MKLSSLAVFNMFHSNRYHHYHIVTLSLMVVLILMNNLILYLNLFYFHYPRVSGIAGSTFSLTVIAMHLVSYCYHGEKYKTAVQWINQLSLLGIILIVGIALVIEVISTPFPLVDQRIFYLDKVMGLNISSAVFFNVKLRRVFAASFVFHHDMT